MLLFNLFILGVVMHFYGSIGSLGKYQDEKDVVGIIVKNSTLLNTDNGLRIKTWPGSPPSEAKGILFQDIILKNVKNPIIIDQLYCPSGSACRSQVCHSHCFIDFLLKLDI